MKLFKQVIRLDFCNFFSSSQRRKMTLPYGFEFDKFEGRRRAVQGYLKRIIESVVSQASANIIDKSSIYRFLKIPPIDLVVFGTDKDPRLVQNNTGATGISREQALVPIFMKDPEISFENVMSFGHDFKVILYLSATDHQYRFLSGYGHMVEKHIRCHLHYLLH